MSTETKKECSSPEKQPVWSAEDLSSNPHVASDKAQRVEAMFDSISHRYDLNNRIHSFCLDQQWRRRAVALSAIQPQEHVVDVACGTGDLSIAFAKANANSVIGIDFTQGMIDLAKQKAKQENLAIEFLHGDAMSLDLPNECADVISIAFGIRNVQEPAIAIKEFYRVLRPNGRLVILEFSAPKNALVRYMNNLYTKHIMPKTASFIAGDNSGAYHYLPKSVDTFLEADALAKLAEEGGFSNVIQTPLTFGVCTVTVGSKVILA